MGHTTKSIDLNADLGEGYGYDAALLDVVSTCNVACGGHTGDQFSMRETIMMAVDNNVIIGAHPSYPDPEGFGRRNNFLQGPALAASLRQQVSNLAAIAASLGVSIRHVKPHGALYNDAGQDLALATIVTDVVASFDGPLAVVGQPGSMLEVAAAEANLRFIAEAFVDRLYRPTGGLMPRSEDGAVFVDLDLICEQAVAIATTGQVRANTGTRISAVADTLCIHGDTPGAARAARAVRSALEKQGVNIHAVA